MKQSFDGIDLERLDLSRPDSLAAASTIRLEPAARTQSLFPGSTEDSVCNDRKHSTERLTNLVLIDYLRHQRFVHKGKPTVQKIHPAMFAYAGDLSVASREAFEIPYLNALFPNAKCLDRRDRVYALMTLEMRPGGRSWMRGLRGLIDADYTITEAELFVRLCKVRFSEWRKRAFWRFGLDLVLQ